MREIKFRAWDTEEKKMRYANDNVDFSELFVWFDGEVGDIDPTCPDGGIGGFAGVLMQFTGLLDKNGKEIYESDILKDFGEVVWIEQLASFRINPSRDNKDISFTESFANVDDLEIIGNLWENPELIK